MRKAIKERMAAAEIRMMDDAPKALERVKELKQRFKSLYRMDEFDFEEAVCRALALSTSATAIAATWRKERRP